MLSLKGPSAKLVKSNQIRIQMCTFAEIMNIKQQFALSQITIGRERS